MVNPVPLVPAILNNPLAQEALVPVTDHIRYTVSCTKHVRHMRDKNTLLNDARVGVEKRMEHNERNALEIPTNVPGWLEEVRKINDKVENMPTDVGCCFNIKIRHKIGRRAFKINEEIDNILRRNSEIVWADYRIPPGRIGSMNASTSAAPSSDHHDEFPSREHIFTEALKALEPNHESIMVALCGMGGVGKTQMMQRLKKIVQVKKLFDFWVDVAIGQKPDLIDIQNSVAYYLGIEIKVPSQPARIDMLRKRFEAVSEGGKTKFLIILDDVWGRFDLNDIGLSPLPNQGINFKVLLTSQDIDICNMMRVEASLTLSVKVLTEAEAQSLFRRVVGISDDADRELNKIGKDIVKRCCGLPRAIDKIAVDLRNKSKGTWNDTFSRLKQHDINTIAPTGFEKSLNNLEEETRSIFLLCGLFHRVIPTEELVRYGCGLKVFNGVCTIEKARIRLKRLIEQLMHKNLLMESEDVSCIKMHDLMLSFVLNIVSKGEHASFVRYGSMPEWPEDDMSIYERIISTCEGMIGFPKNLTFPKLSILKLMEGDESLSFPSYFYKEMTELKVISYDNMKRYPAIHGCSIKLRVLHLHQCSLKPNDCYSIGTLYNLEVLSFAKSNIQWLPSIIGKLKKLRLLDLTKCSVIRIDEGVFKSLENLEELYAIAGGEDTNAIRFTNDNLNEMAERSKKLSALEFEFFGSNAQLENISLVKLKRFKISVGRYLDGGFCKSAHSYENTLQLVTNSSDISKYKMNVLFRETEVLCLSVADMHDLEDIEVKSTHPRQHSSFYNLKVLVVSKCAELKYLFTLAVAKDLSKLEHLEVDECNDMEQLIQTSGSGKKVTFPKLKFLSLRGLCKLSALCPDVNIIELPQLVELQLSTLPNITNIYPMNNSETSCLLKKEIGVPKLEKLQIEHLDNLKEVWPREFMTSDKFTLRMIHVSYCGNLVNLFPCNPMLSMHHLEEIQVTHCDDIEVLFNIDMDRVGEIREENILNLRRIQVKHCDNLVNLFPDNSMPMLSPIEELEVENCRSIKMLFNSNWDCGAEIGEGNIRLKRIKVSNCDNLVNLFPCNPMPLLHNLEELQVENCGSIEVLFNIDLGYAGQFGEGYNKSSLRNIQVKELEKLIEVWRIKGENNSRLPIRGFQAVETITISECTRFRNVFTPTTINLDLGERINMKISNHRESGRHSELEEDSQKKNMV